MFLTVKEIIHLTLFLLKSICIEISLIINILYPFFHPYTNHHLYFKRKQFLKVYVSFFVCNNSNKGYLVSGPTCFDYLRRASTNFDHVRRTPIAVKITVIC